MEREFTGAYIDFNGMNGYMVVGPNLVIYDFSFSGKSLMESGKKQGLFFNVLDGYSFKGIEFDIVLVILKCMVDMIRV